MVESEFEDLGPNSGLAEEMHGRYVEDPTSVPDEWREFFDHRDDGASAPSSPASSDAGPARAPTRYRAPEPERPSPPPPAAPSAPAAPALTADGDKPVPLRGATARIVENMEASLAVPTATSVRTVPAKLLEVNRQILNNQLARTGGRKVSFTHLIAFAAVQAARREPAMLSGYVEVDGKAGVGHPDHINLGLAVDVQRDDGSRTLLVPNIKQADTLDFAGFFTAYEELIRKVRNGKLGPDDFAGTTATITNPGMIGTVHSVPRLVAGQSFIL